MQQEYCKVSLITGEFKLVRKETVIGVCHNNIHKGILTVNLLKKHDCLGKNCTYLEKYKNKSYWHTLEKEEEEKNKRKIAKKENQVLEKDKKKTCNDIKNQVNYIAEKYDFKFKALEVKQITDNRFNVFYVSDKKKNDWSSFSPIIKTMREFYNYHLTLIHIRDVDGNYTTINEI